MSRPKKKDEKKRKFFVGARITEKEMENFAYVCAINGIDISTGLRKAMEIYIDIMLR